MFVYSQMVFMTPTTNLIQMQIFYLRYISLTRFLYSLTFTFERMNPAGHPWNGNKFSMP